MSEFDDELEDLTEPEELAEEIVHWQPTHRPAAEARPAFAAGALTTGAGTALLLGLGAVAVGALAIGAMAIGRLAVGKAHFKELEIDNLVVHKLTVLEQRRRL